MTAPIAILAVSALFLGVMLTMSRWLAGHLPASGEVPVHFNWRGQPDRFGSRWVTLALLPAIYGALCVVTAWMAAIRPDRINPEDFAPALLGHLVTSLIVLVAHGLVMWLMLRWVRQQR
ncbi:DUF1648 domain-containing protein [Altererythrobacter lauratis]|uniref:DUF1648 domain-containing protein n=1 Tax=Alteraurantiacibacter lauratis TaxID=2054627 RepID=A0ABV7ECH0_9SPHN